MMNGKRSGDFTEFPSLADERDPTADGSIGFIGGFLGRLFRPAGDSASSSSANISAMTVATDSSDPVENDEVADLSPLQSAEAEGDDVSVSSEQSRKLSQRLSSFFRGNQSQLIDYDRSEHRRYWMPDSTVKECYECHEKFSAFRRKHHCRLCGQIFCGKCSKHSINGAQLGYAGLLRVCGYCEKNVDSYLSTNATKPRRGDTNTSNIGPDQSSSNSTNTVSGISTVSSGPILFTNDSSLLCTGDSRLHHSISSSEMKANSDSLNLPNGDPSHLSIQQLQDFRRYMLEDSSQSIAIEATTSSDSNEPEWVRNIVSVGRHRSDDFQSIECQAFEIQPCIVPEESTSKTSKCHVELPLTNGEIKTDDLNELFEQKLERMLDFLFQREQLDRETWRSVIWPLSKEIASTVKVDILRRGSEESMNILRYVHIKKLLVSATEPDYEIIDGVACSKSLAYTDMSKIIDNASVMVLTGGIEYERGTQKLTSIDPIIEQESEFLKNHVDRITSRRVSLLLVEESVSKLAADHFMQANVSLVTNVKRSVLERVARSTKATITCLMDVQMHPGIVGFCPQFKERTVAVKGGKKSLLIFDDCQAELGVSVLLRASSMRELRAAKRILQFMVLLRYSAKTEIDFLNMFESKPSKVPPSCQVCACNTCDMQGPKNPFLDELRSAVLSGSPLIHFPPPYFETLEGKSSYLLNYFRKPTSHYFTEEDFIARMKSERELEVKMDNLLAELQKEKKRIDSFKWPIHARKNVTSADVFEITRFRARGALLFNARRTKKQAVTAKARTDAHQLRQSLHQVSLAVKGPNFDVFNPYNHQRIAFLYSSFAKKAVNTPCSGPWLVVWEFFAAQDRTLGAFLTNFCLNEGYKCKSCSKSMVDHQRKFVHKHARIEITTQIYLKPGDDGGEGLPPSFAADNDAVLAWRRCPSCKSNSAVSPLSPSVWHMSFAKFIDYLANGLYCVSSLLGSTDCDHCTFHEQQHFFSRKNFTTCFKVIPIRPLHVLFSPILCSVEPMSIKCQSVINKRLESLSLCNTIFSEAEAFVQSHEGLLRANDAFDSISLFVSSKRKQFENMVVDFATDEKFQELDIIQSKDPDYLKAMDMFTRCRQFLFNFMQQWNKARTAYDLLVLSRKSGSHPISTHSSAANLQDDPVEDLVFRDSNGISEATSDANLVNNELKELPAAQIGVPLPKNYHWELEFNDDGVPVIVKDMLDHRGNTHPDIGSIIAYALASKDYSLKKRQLRDFHSDQGEPLTLRNVAHGSVDASAAHSLPKDTNANIEVEFGDSRAHYYVKVYFAEHFDLLRKTIFVDGEDQFIRSLSTSGSWHPEGGKSGASFFRTQDERFIFKQLSSVELDAFRKCAPNYFDYIYTAVTEKKLTALGKIYGIYQVAYRNKVDNQEFKMDVLVMEFLFYRKKIKQLWDLKGSLRNRYASTKSAAPVMLDENFVQDLWGNQIYVQTHAKAALNQAMAIDSHFLTSLDIMDYSLLAGICEDTDEVVIGIVDYMRTFTLDKKLESFVKTALPTSHLPTVVSPAAYCRRFCEAIDTYFPFSPDAWTELNST